MKLGSAAGAPISLILALVFPAMIAASIALAYYGYRSAESVTGTYEEVFQREARNTADDIVRALEARIEKDAQTTFARLSEERSAQASFAPQEPCSVDPEPSIAAYAVFADDLRALECVWPRVPPGKQTKRPRDRWLAELRRLPWKAVKPGQFAYHQTLSEQGSLLIAYGRRVESDESVQNVAALFDLDLVKSWLEAELVRPRLSRRVSVFDGEGGAVSSDPNGGDMPYDDERLRMEANAGKALYRWRIHITPANVEAFRTQARRQRVIQPLLVIFSTVIIAVGLAVVWLTVTAERRASRLKSDFIANVSHELKTPLSLIRMFGELVATGKHKGEASAREYGGIITRESERLSHLIDNVLDFARLERGKASYHFAEGYMQEVLERALDVCRYRLEKERMKLRTVVEPGLPPVRMDDNAMTLVILNLVDNAMKYAAEGGQVEVALSRSPGGVVLGVRDFGPGIAPEEQSRIFERFYRAQNAREGNVRGSGIGLALVKHIAEAHGGRVVVESPAPGARRGDLPGAAFRVYLPAPVSDSSTELADSAGTSDLEAAKS